MKGLPGLLKHPPINGGDLQAIARSGSIRALEMMIDWSAGGRRRCYSDTVRRLIFLSITEGKFDSLRWLLERFRTPSLSSRIWRAVLEAPASPPAALEAVWAFYPLTNLQEVKVANIGLLHWLLAKGIAFRIALGSLNDAVRRGDIEFVRQCLEYRKIDDCGAMLYNALESAQWEIYALLMESKAPMIDCKYLFDYHFPTLVQYHNLAAIKFACHWALPSAPLEAIQAAVRRGYMPFVEYFFSRFKDAFDAAMVSLAAGSGRLEQTVTWLLFNFSMNIEKKDAQLRLWTRPP
ncbi:hypothetical protein ATCC90586_010426 [Pythium insidiosum]|nr:hypothetical protein ATCC90586_010426 [Pythium insidiosum]